MRTLRILAALSVVLIVGCFLLTQTGIRGGPFLVSFATYSILSTLGGELGFAVGILALAATASRRQFAWFALFALLVLLLNLLPLVVFQTGTNFGYPNFLDISIVYRANGPLAWILLLPALLPGAAFVYTLMVSDGRPRVAGISHNRAG